MSQERSSVCERMAKPVFRQLGHLRVSTQQSRIILKICAPNCEVQECALTRLPPSKGTRGPGSREIAGIPRALMAAYIRSPTTLREQTIRADVKTAVPKSAR